MDPSRCMHEEWILPVVFPMTQEIILKIYAVANDITNDLL